MFYKLCEMGACNANTTGWGRGKGSCLNNSQLIMTNLVRRCVKLKSMTRRVPLPEWLRGSECAHHEIDTRSKRCTLAAHARTEDVTRWLCGPSERNETKQLHGRAQALDYGAMMMNGTVFRPAPFRYQCDAIRRTAALLINYTHVLRTKCMIVIRRNNLHIHHWPLA